jgi:hypothetical protein
MLLARDEWSSSRLFRLATPPLPPAAALPPLPDSSEGLARDLPSSLRVRLDRLVPLPPPLPLLLLDLWDGVVRREEEVLLLTEDAAFRLDTLPPPSSDRRVGIDSRLLL